ncbi:MAG: hypothetical protein E7388_02510 [Ruminococcaceae bacterium]|nr:hypothetical protein [Oscillospiraceae bacterium]
MSKLYKPQLGGFANKLGLKNGIDELIRRPVPQQEILHLNNNDINGPRFDGKSGNKYNRRRNYRKHR